MSYINSLLDSESFDFEVYKEILLLSFMSGSSYF